MKSNVQIIGAVLVGLGAILLATYTRGICTQNRNRVTKKQAVDAENSWEGEGGAIGDCAQQSSAA